eukprot:TRINITY_DN378_c0_g1_i1.p1 TRINITY_DN378_c0_g1~~TRINITY_DN378_c0_g1_i1.p1  ORF type:complete len:388 (+),score=62.25 TRINITY_DN378_c0_g1_i1:76-1239(+)
MPARGSPPSPAEEKVCRNLQNCRLVVHHVLGKLPCFDPDYDICFCATCTADRGERDETYSRGAYPYALPSGCAKLGIKIMPGNKEHMRGPDSWAPCFHGSTLSAVKAILESPDHTPCLLPPGAFAPDGRQLGTRTDEARIMTCGNRWNKHAKQREWFDKDQCFFSPSMRMCEYPGYARLEEVDVPELGVGKFTIQVALQVWLQPGTFGVGHETVNAKGRLCDVIPNECLEYYTKRHCTHFVSGLVIRIRSGPLHMAVPQRRRVEQRPPVGLIEPPRDPEPQAKPAESPRATPPPPSERTHREEPAGVTRRRREAAGEATSDKNDGTWWKILLGVAVVGVIGCLAVDAHGSSEYERGLRDGREEREWDHAASSFDNEMSRSNFDPEGE